MKIGLSMRVIEERSYTERRDALAQDWCALCDGLNVALVAIPNTLKNPGCYVESLEIDGLILTGGNNLGDAPERDETEKALLAWAVEKKLPVFGVCRGLQMINHFFGGKVSSEIATAASLQDHHVATSHGVRVLDDGWASIVGSDVMVNSFHDQGVLVADLSPDLIATAVTHDGQLVEALAHEYLPIVAIQWHPERSGPSQDLDRQLLTHFLKAGTTI